jgi:hypothetical protein
MQYQIGIADFQGARMTTRLAAGADAKKLQFQTNALLLRAARITPKEDQDVTPKFATISFMITRSSMIIFGMVVGMSISTNAETVKVMAEASTDGSFTIAQTNGMGAARGAPGHPTGLPSGEWGRRRGQAQLQAAGTPESACNVQPV